MTGVELKALFDDDEDVVPRKLKRVKKPTVEDDDEPMIKVAASFSISVL